MKYEVGRMRDEKGSGECLVYGGGTGTLAGVFIQSSQPGVAVLLASAGADACLAGSAVPRSERPLRVLISANPLRSQRHRTRINLPSKAPRPDPSLRDRRDKNRLCAGHGFRPGTTRLG